MRYLYTIILLVTLYTNMAFATATASAVMEIRVSGSSNNAGIFDSGVVSPGTDYSQQDAAQFQGTDLASISGTTNPCVVTSATHNFVSTDNGNWIQVTAGTNWTSPLWAEIVSTAANAAVLDRACGSSATLSGGTWFLGGAYKFANAAKDTTFLALSQAGNTIWLKFNATQHSTVSNINTGTGGATTPITMAGYLSTRGDNPTGDNRPSWNENSAQLNMISNIIFKNIILQSNANAMLQVGNGGIIINSKIFNSGGGFQNGGFAVDFTGRGYIENSEIISVNGFGIWVASGISAQANGVFIHDSDVCVGTFNAAASTLILTNSILAGCYSAGISILNGGLTPMLFMNNTIVGWNTPIASSSGILLTSTATRQIFENNILWGFATGLASPDTASVNYNNYNNFFNNTADISTWPKGPNSYALDPKFANVRFTRGTSASTSSATLTDSGASFNAAGIVDNKTFVALSACTGCTKGNFLITGHTNTTLTVNSAMGTGSSVTYQFRTGDNFAVSPSMKFKGFPGLFNGGATTGYLDLGAAQRHEYGKPGGK